MVQFFTSILFSHLFKMDQGASELSKRNVFYNNFVGLADSSAELLNILNFLKSLLPDYCGVSFICFLSIIFECSILYNTIYVNRYIIW